MNWLYIPELKNLALNMDQYRRVYVSEKGKNLHYISIDGTENRMPIPDDNWIEHEKTNNAQTVRDRLDMFFLNKGPAV